MSSETVDTRVAAGLPAQLTSRAQLLADGAELTPDCGRAAAEAAIAALGPAIEVADVDPSRTDLTEIVATNVFHRAVLFGEPVAGVSLEGVVARSPGDELALDLGPLGSLSLAFEP